MQEVEDRVIPIIVATVRSNSESSRIIDRVSIGVIKIISFD
jgi:hypothetical protein